MADFPNIGIIKNSKVEAIYVQENKYGRFRLIGVHSMYADKFYKCNDFHQFSSFNMLDHVKPSLSLSAWKTRELRVKTYQIFRITEDQLHERYPNLMLDVL